MNFDTGSNFIWATVDDCQSDACNSHNKINTSYPGFMYSNPNISIQNFGPWGEIYTKDSNIDIYNANNSFDISFFSAIDYNGKGFKYLQWDGGIGLLSESRLISGNTSFFVDLLLKQRIVTNSQFSFITNNEEKIGQLLFGEDDDNVFIRSSRIELPPKKDRYLYIWGTPLHYAKIGDNEIYFLRNNTINIDSGSSCFKGDDYIIIPILNTLFQCVDQCGKRIFETIMDNNQLIGLAYSKNGDPSMFLDILPLFTINLGNSCNNDTQYTAQISFDASQYSYFVEAGEYQGRWVVGFSVLNQVGSFVVGSNLMDYFYTTYTYIHNSDFSYSQGNMYLYSKTFGVRPKHIKCMPKS